MNIIAVRRQVHFRLPGQRPRYPVCRIRSRLFHNLARPAHPDCCKPGSGHIPSFLPSGFGGSGFEVVFVQIRVGTDRIGFPALLFVTYTIACCRAARYNLRRRRRLGGNNHRVRQPSESFASRLTGWRQNTWSAPSPGIPVAVIQVFVNLGVGTRQIRVVVDRSLSIFTSLLLTTQRPSGEMFYRSANYREIESKPAYPKTGTKKYCRLLLFVFRIGVLTW